MANGTAIRRGVCVAVAFVVFGQWLVVAPSAEASASGCVRSQHFKHHSCVDVHGGGVHVDWARGGVGLPARDTAAGFFELFAADWNHRTPDGTYDNRSLRAQTEWGPRVHVGRAFPHGTKFCAAFHENNGDGTYARREPACVTITR